MNFKGKNLLAKGIQVTVNPDSDSRLENNEQLLASTKCFLSSTIAGHLARYRARGWGAPVLTQRAVLQAETRVSVAKVRLNAHTFSFTPRHLQQQHPSKSIQPQPRYRMCMIRRGPAGSLKTIYSPHSQRANKDIRTNKTKTVLNVKHKPFCALLYSKWNFSSEKLNMDSSETFNLKSTV